MCTCSLVKNINRQLIFIFISFFMTLCEGKNDVLSSIDKNYCPFIETLSFGSDIHIKCNNSYLIFNEITNEAINWKFANQTSTCNQNKTQEASVNQCGISRIGSNYLKVPLKSLENEERACIYCRIDYKPIAPLITAVQLDEGEYTLYSFNITAADLAHNESFEILWAKRVNALMRHSYNYWFLQGCVDSIVKILVNTAHTIIFTVDDVAIDRVEFIIRRCNGTCRKYDPCPEEQFFKEIDSNYFQNPDSIEKISCDSNCLNGINTPSITTRIHRPHTVSSTSSTTTTTPLKLEQKMKFIILVVSIGSLIIIIILIILIRYTLCKVKGKKHVYAKAHHVDPDEHK